MWSVKKRNYNIFEKISFSVQLKRDISVSRAEGRFSWYCMILGLYQGLLEETPHRNLSKEILM